jgi:FAD/FMN-containing dehydrogenase
LLKGLQSKLESKPEADLAKAIHLLRAVLPDKGYETIKTVVTDKDVLKAYSATNYTAYIGSEDAKSHGVVVFPSTTEEVSMIVKIAQTCGLSVVSRGSGTGLEGHATSVSRSQRIFMTPTSSILGEMVHRDI